MYVQANLPETSPFLSAQMALVSTFFQMFIVLGMYKFRCSAFFFEKKDAAWLRTSVLVGTQEHFFPVDHSKPARQVILW